MVHCGGVEAVLRAAGVDMRLAIQPPAEAEAAAAAGGIALSRASGAPTAAAAAAGQCGAAEPQQGQQQQLCAGAGQGGSSAELSSLTGREGGWPSYAERSVQSLPASPVKQQQQLQEQGGGGSAIVGLLPRMVQSLPSSPVGARRQAVCGEPLQSFSSAPTSPAVLQRSGGAGSGLQQQQLACALQQLWPLGSPNAALAAAAAAARAGSGSAGIAEGLGHSREPSPGAGRGTAGGGHSSEPAGDSMPQGASEGGGREQEQGPGRQQRREPGSAWFRLADYEKLTNALAQFKQRTGLALLPAAGAIPRGTLLACRCEGLGWAGRKALRHCHPAVALGCCLACML